ncbi:MAG: DUF499 domain-containing protein [Candidatus Lokiarchaeota archaeon]|nr:DUF499 domain-containing protein [Candidatus Lokiarchaeota archaeon]
MGTVPNIKGTVHIDTGVKTRTFLGEIFYQLGVYSMVKELDEKGGAFGTETIKECLKLAGPCVILIDEFLLYVTKMYPYKDDPDYAPVVSSLFPAIQELYTAISNSDSAMLVITYPSRPEQIFDENARHYKAELFAWLETYKEISSRSVTSKMVAKSDAEIGQILQVRLFEKIAPRETREKVGKSFFTYYKDHKDEFPHYITAEDYSERIMSTYPFHPELLRIFHEQWGTLPRFQLTRDLLTILAETIVDEFQKDEKKRRKAALIMPAHVNLRDPAIRALIFDIIGKDYEPILASDLRRAEAIDKLFEGQGLLGQDEYTLGITTAIFLHSFTGSTAKLSPRDHIASIGASIPSCLVSTLVPKYTAPFEKGDAGLPVFEDIMRIVKKLLDAEIGLYYLHCSIDKQYYFDLQKNLTHFAANEFNQMAGKLDDLYKEIETIWRCTKVPIVPVPFPQRPQDINSNNESIYLVLLDPTKFSEKPQNKNFKHVEFLAEYAMESSPTATTGDKVRFNKNRLVFLAAGDSTWNLVELYYKWFRAWKTTTDLTIFKNATKPEQDHANLQVSEYQEKYKTQIQLLFSHLYTFKPDGKINPDPKDLKQFLYVKDIVPCHQIYSYLTGEIDENEALIWNTLRPELLANAERYQHAWGASQPTTTAQEVWDRFAQDTALPMLENKVVLKKCINEGLKKGLFGVAYKEAGQEAASHVVGEDEELDTKRPFGEILLFRPGTDISVQCKDCQKTFKFDSDKADYLCPECTRVSCHRCGATVRAKEITAEGCTKCRDMVACPSCHNLVMSTDLKLGGTKCVICMGKVQCPACKTHVLEDKLLPSPSDAQYCEACKSWEACKGCGIRFAPKDLVDGYCKKCRPPAPQKLKCRGCGKEFLPHLLEDGLCASCRQRQATYVKEIQLTITLQNLNREASVFTDILEAFGSKGLDTSTSAKVGLTIAIQADKSIWETEADAKSWIDANFKSQNRQIDMRIKLGTKKSI